MTPEDIYERALLRAGFDVHRVGCLVSVRTALGTSVYREETPRLALAYACSEVLGYVPETVTRDEDE